jgi:hypothetical protein
MKLTNLIVLASVLCLATSCGEIFSEEYYDDYGYGEDYGNNDYGYNDQEYGAYEEQGGMENRQAVEAQAVAYNNGGGIQMHPVKNPQTGMEVCKIPLPSGWKLTSKGWDGPGTIEVMEQKGNTYTDQTGGIPSLNQVLQSELKPKMQQLGLQVLNTIQLPKVAQKDQQEYAKYWKVAPTQERSEAVGIEYRDKEGKKGLVVVHYMTSRSQYGNMGFYYMHVMGGASPGQYEQAKKDVIYALVNYQNNPQAIAAHNQKEQQKSNASWANHNAKMKRNQDNFNAWNSAQVESSNSISDMSMESWRRRNAISDRGHEKTIDGIWERQPMVDPHTGNYGKVESGYNHYYMNNNGEYIGTNDALYNPQTDPNVNNYNWEEMQYRGY